MDVPDLAYAYREKTKQSTYRVLYYFTVNNININYLVGGGPETCIYLSLDNSYLTNSQRDNEQAYGAPPPVSFHVAL